MPEDTLGTGGSVGGSPSGSPAPEAAPVASGSEEMVPVSRLNGLMSTLNKEQDARRAAEARAAAAEARAAQATPPAPAVPDIDAAVRAIVEPATAETRAVFNMLKSTETGRLLSEYPYATAEDIRGATPEEWAASAKAAHERVKTLVDERAAAVKAEAEEEARRSFGLPPGIGPSGGAAVGTAEDYKERLQKAKEAGDPAAVAALLLMQPVE